MFSILFDMNTIYTRLTLQEREEISRGIWAFEKFSSIAQRLGRPISTDSREVWSNTRYSWRYSAAKAQKRANIMKSKGRPQKLNNNESLKNYVYEKLRLKWSP